MLPKVCPGSQRGLPVNFTFKKFRAPKNALSAIFRFCTFLCPFSESRARSSGYVQKFILFRTNPILYNNLYVFGFRARVPCFSIFALYRYGRGCRVLFRFCLYFVHFRKYDTKIVICVLL